MLYLAFYTWFTPSSKAISADKLEVTRNIVHFLSFKVRDYYVYFIAAGIMHTTQQHEFWELHNKICEYRRQEDSK